jgi:hypothetical protein
MIPRAGFCESDSQPSVVGGFIARAADGFPTSSGNPCDGGIGTGWAEGRFGLLFPIFRCSPNDPCTEPSLQIRHSWEMYAHRQPLPIKTNVRPMEPCQTQRFSRVKRIRLDMPSPGSARELHTKLVLPLGEHGKVQAVPTAGCHYYVVMI